MRRNRRALDGRIPRAAHRENRIADRLGVQPPHRHMRQQPITRILFTRARWRQARKLIRGAAQHQPVHRLHRPSRLDKPAGQPIEQLRMQRPLAHAPEVVRRRHQPFAEMMLPDPVHHHARHQRIRPARQRINQRQPPTPRDRPRAHQSRQTSRNFLAQVQMTAANVEP